MMALPTIDVPTFELTIPGTEKNLKFRPFLVKENKLLTLAAESDIVQQVSACEQVVVNCSFGELDPKDLAMYQLQWLFLQLRSQSIGSIQSYILKCGACEHQFNYEMDINDFKIVGNTETDTKKIELNPESGVVFKYPSAHVQAVTTNLSDIELLINCIEYIYTADEVIKPEDIDIKELTEWIEDLPLEVANEISAFFMQAPLLGHTVNFTCSKCEEKNQVVINGYEHFFG